MFCKNARVLNHFDRSISLLCFVSGSRVFDISCDTPRGPSSVDLIAALGRGTDADAVVPGGTSADFDAASIMKQPDYPYGGIRRLKLSVSSELKRGVLNSRTLNGGSFAQRSFSAVCTSITSAK